MSRENVIDAVSTADEAERRRATFGDRGASSLGDVKRRTVPGGKVLGVIVALFIVAGMGVLGWHVLRQMEAESKESPEVAEDSAIRNTMPGLKTTDPAPAQKAPSLEHEADGAAEPIKPETTTASAPSAGSSGPTQPPPPSPAQLLRERRLRGGLSGEATGSIAGGQAASGDPAADQAHSAAYPSGGGLGGSAGEPAHAPTMADRLSPVRLSAARAGQVGSMDMLLLQSAMIDCAMNVRVDSSVPGMMSCDATRDVYSTNGRTVLLDRGTRFTGRYEQGIVKGQGRIFVVWERAVTPLGVIINLDSPGADPLGGSGFPGKVNNHFWQRFGAAMLVSVFEDAGDYAVAKGQEGNNNYYGANTTQSARDNSSIVLENQINIPPTLTKRHGDRINIFVARDLDFSGIYELRSRH
ncbi:type IV secretion system protein VirB10 [Xanthomonas perforans]|uniref:TrbI/VirB10 family protein n=6 Tax=Xanthomonas TaxID=338 RepID=A0A6L9VST2_XANPE|nr:MULTISPECIES: type IV secretion system protein VirB10 [Xanthomonas]MBZ2415042.1 type IV secretion system protein VirB10 [Xanthomonas perforans]MBZ2423623.1 type IV secretion system protein VirB10 [Xanthomonas perforans]MBZ2427915.1 type IV secretion system protein VirB10 [Xanthomonas perforans]MBZ2457124.1 type IV secretion system protein VirB10 [Xanthomonas perforans]MBZ2470060.1 type IV secretion system protein VirB10 [Xanthomonas perforans]